MELTEQIAMVLVVFALLGGLLWVLKRRGFASLPLGPRRNAGSRRLEVLERAVLTPHHTLHLVRVSGKVVLIGTAPSNCSLLDAAVTETAAAPISPNAFTQGLGVGQ
jgi:flagellar biogenesis protein FliO